MLGTLPFLVATVMQRFAVGLAADISLQIATRQSGVAIAGFDARRTRLGPWQFSHCTFSVPAKALISVPAVASVDANIE